MNFPRNRHKIPRHLKEGLRNALANVVCALLLLPSGCGSQYLGEKTEKRPVLNAKTGKTEEKVQNPELYALLPLAITVDVASAPILTVIYIATIIRDWR